MTKEMVKSTSEFKARLAVLFDALRDEGFFARQNYWHNEDAAGKAIRKDVEKGQPFCYYTKKDNPFGGEGKTGINLTVGGPKDAGQTVVDAAVEAGLTSSLVNGKVLVMLPLGNRAPKGKASKSQD